MDRFLEGSYSAGLVTFDGVCDPIDVDSFDTHVSQNISTAGSVECFFGDKAFGTSWGALRNNSYHSVRISLHCIY